MFKAIDDEFKKWVHGAYKKHLPYQPYPVGGNKPDEKEYVHYIITDGFADWGLPRSLQGYTVLAETVCEYIGKEDAHGNKIYENDIIDSYLTGKRIGIVHWDQPNCRYIVVDENGNYVTDFTQITTEAVEIVGNIFDGEING